MVPGDGVVNGLEHVVVSDVRVGLVGSEKLQQVSGPLSSSDHQRGAAGENVVDQACKGRGERQ